MSITVFGLLAAVGFLVSGFFLWKRAREEHLPEREIFDIYVISALWAIAISRAVSVILRFSSFGLNPLRWFSIFSLPGFNGVGALVGGAVILFLALTKRDWNRWLMLDIYLPAILLWQAFLIALFRIDVAVLFLISTVLLWKTERSYRLWEWYGSRRGGAQPGLVASMWFIAEGIGFCLLARGSNSVLSFLASGIVLVVVGVVMAYRRSGRFVKSDILQLRDRVAVAVKPKRASNKKP